MEPSSREECVEDIYNAVAEAAEHLRRHGVHQPEIGIFTGTGLEESVRSVQVRQKIAYSDLPHFPLSTVESHPGRLLFGEIDGRAVLVMQGRFHLYEGYRPDKVVFPVRVMQALGVKVMIVTNAAGGLNPRFRAGDIMILEDHINLTGENPLIGPNEERWGARFPDMSRAYDARLADRAAKSAGQLGISVQRGTYAGLKGPSLETPAEVRFLKRIGADAVGFSTVQEVIAGVHAGLKILGLSTITNLSDPDRPVPATVADIIAVARRTAPQVDALIHRVVEQLDDDC
jgi:purine-nucleoside phosphorylase